MRPTKDHLAISYYFPNLRLAVGRIESVAFLLFRSSQNVESASHIICPAQHLLCCSLMAVPQVYFYCSTYPWICWQLTEILFFCSPLDCMSCPLCVSRSPLGAAAWHWCRIHSDFVFRIFEAQPGKPAVIGSQSLGIFVCLFSVLWLKSQ